MKWFKFQAKAENAVEISIYDEIGMWGVNAKEFISELKQHAGKVVTLTINSPGGSVFDALAIYNALRAHGSEITVKVMGVAASAASLIAMAGDKIIMPENTFMMIHNPMVGAYGNADEMRDMADVLDKIAASLIGTYVARTGMSEDDVKALLDAETWLNAEEAVAKGFATELEPALKVAAAFDLARLPDNIKAVFSANSGEPGDEEDTGEPEGDPEGDGETADDEATNALADDITDMAKAHGMEAYATTFALSAKSIDEAKSLIVNAREINALCVVAKKPDMAAAMINSGVDLDSARKQLVDALAAEADALNTSNVQKLQKTQAAASGSAVWAKIFPTAEQSKE